MESRIIALLDSIIFELQRAGGISLYWSELLRRHQPSQTILFGRKNDNIFASELDFKLQAESYPTLLPRRYLPFRPKFGAATNGKHIFHSSYLRYSKHPEAINVTTIHDFTYEHYVDGPRKWLHSWQKRQAVKRSVGIICVSYNTKRDLLRFCPWLHENQIRVIYNGVGDSFFPVADPWSLLNTRFRLSAENPFLLFVGDRSSYKNFDIFVGLASRFPSFDLVVVGGKPFSNEELNSISSFSRRVRHFRGVSPETLNLLYNAAFCLVYPSSYEGFGIPILEAMKAGCPVVSTSLSSIPEVAGDAALLVDEVYVENFADKINILIDESSRNRLIADGYAQANKFSWDECFKKTYAFYQELWDRSEIK